MSCQNQFNEYVCQQVRDSDISAENQADAISSISDEWYSIDECEEDRINHVDRLVSEYSAREKMPINKE